MNTSPATVSAARVTLASARAMTGADLSAWFRANQAADTLDAYHASRVAAGHKAAKTRRADQDERAEQTRAAKRRQAAIRAGITRRLNADLRRPEITTRRAA